MHTSFLTTFYPISTSEFELIRTPDYTLKACLYHPQGIKHVPAVVCVHGGAWVSGDRTAVSGFTDLIAQTGIAVLAIDTRLAPRFPYPASVADVVYAVRWLKQHAEACGIDRNRIGTLGVSSGGYLALLSTMRYDNPEYRIESDTINGSVDAKTAFVATCSGVLDPLARYQMAERRGDIDIIQCHDAFFQTVQTMEETSPPLILERHEKAYLPPALFFQGELDPRLPSDTAEKTADAWNRAEGKAQAIVYPDAGHSVGTWSREAILDMLTRFHALASVPDSFKPD